MSEPTIRAGDIRLSTDTCGHVVVHPTASVLKQAAIEAIQTLPVNEDTELFCLYVLRALKSPEIVASDLHFLEAVDTTLRNRRLARTQANQWLLRIAVGAIVAVVSYIAGLLPRM